jgi:hypothetical protein
MCTCTVQFSLRLCSKNKLPGVGLVAYVLAVDCFVVVSVPTVVEAVQNQGKGRIVYYDHAK